MTTAIEAAPACEPSQVVKACYDTLKHFNNTAELERQLGKRPGVLPNEINPNQRSHKFGLFDAIRIMHLTGDAQILRAIAATLGYSIYSLGDYSGISDVELLNCYSQFHAEVGDMNRAIAESLADGDIEQHEFERIENELQQVFAAALELLERLRALVRT